MLHIDIAGPFTTSDDGFTYFPVGALRLPVLLYSSMSDCLLHAVLFEVCDALERYGCLLLNRSEAKALPSLTPQESNVFIAIVLVNLPLHTLR